MNIKEIKELLVLMREHNLYEIEMEKEGFKLKLRKTVAGQAIVEEGQANASMVVPIPISSMASGAYTKGAQLSLAGHPVAEEADIVIVRSPMVGTFYAAPAPDQPAYVTGGKKVAEGDVLCIVEAMKLMNEIKTEVAGTIQEVMVKNGQAVEFDQPLFKIKTG